MQGGSCARSLAASLANLSDWILCRCMSFWITGTKIARLAGPIACASAQMVSSCTPQKLIGKKSPMLLALVSIHSGCMKVC